jgi:hypothetical protein
LQKHPFKCLACSIAIFGLKAFGFRSKIEKIASLRSSSVSWVFWHPTHLQLTPQDWPAVNQSQYSLSHLDREQWHDMMDVSLLRTARRLTGRITVGRIIAISAWRLILISSVFPLKFSTELPSLLNSILCMCLNGLYCGMFSLSRFGEGLAHKVLGVMDLIATGDVGIGPFGWEIGDKLDIQNFPNGELGGIFAGECFSF